MLLVKRIRRRNKITIVENRTGVSVRCIHAIYLSKQN